MVCHPAAFTLWQSYHSTQTAEFTLLQSYSCTQPAVSMLQQWYCSIQAASSVSQNTGLLHTTSTRGEHSVRQVQAALDYYFSMSLCSGPHQHQGLVMSRGKREQVCAGFWLCSGLTAQHLHCKDKNNFFTQPLALREGAKQVLSTLQGHRPSPPMQLCTTSMNA